MKPYGLICLVVIAAGLGALWFWTKSRANSGHSNDRALVVVTGDTKHLVTRDMAEAGERMLDRQAPEFSKNATDGLAYRLGDLVRRGPVILTFIKKGCPCSEAAQPYFNNFKNAYPKAQILGVIDVGEHDAKQWGARFRATYPLMPDPALELMRSYDARNSTYVVLVDQNSKIVRYWPGFSKEMFDELGREFARLGGIQLRPFDVSDAPDELYSGCPFDL